MEPLQKLTRRQLEALQVVRTRELPERGVSLKLVATTLGVSAPSALDHLTPLEELGLISRHRGKSRITERGRRTLLEFQRHHRMAETLFAGLGLSPAATCTAAREIDLALSHRTVEELCRVQQHPSICPHGQPIGPCGGSERPAR